MKLRYVYVRRVVVVAIATLACVALLRVLLKVPTRPSGDCTFADLGFWAYPRYNVSFPEIDLGLNAAQTFECSNLPSTTLSFFLRLDATSTDINVAESPVRLACCLIDEYGDTIFHTDERLGKWILASSRDEKRIWFWNTRDLKLRSDRTYRLAITTTGNAKNTERLVATPMFAGGGFEKTW